MVYLEEKGDLFELIGEGYNFVQCISADFAMRAGIAVLFNKYMNIKEQLVAQYGDYLCAWDHIETIKPTENNSLLNSGSKMANGFCLKVRCKELETNVFNLVTKRNASDFPTYDNLSYALKQLATVTEASGIKKLAMPLIGCGIDGCNWDTVSTLVKGHFYNQDIEIVVRYL